MTDQPTSLTVTLDDGEHARTWHVPATRDGVGFEVRDEHERTYTLGTLEHDHPPRVLSWSCVPVPTAPDGVLYTERDEPPAPPDEAAVEARVRAQIAADIQAERPEHEGRSLTSHEAAIDAALQRAASIVRHGHRPEWVEDGGAVVCLRCGIARGGA